MQTEDIAEYTAVHNWTGFIDRCEVPAVSCTERQTNKHQQTTHCWINYCMKSSG